MFPKDLEYEILERENNRFGQGIRSFNISALTQCAPKWFLLKKGKNRFGLTPSTRKCFSLSWIKAEILWIQWVNTEMIHSNTESTLRGNTPIQCKAKSFLLWQDTSYMEQKSRPVIIKIIWNEKPTFSSILAARSKDPRQTRYNWGSWIQNNELLKQDRTCALIQYLKLTITVDTAPVPGRTAWEKERFLPKRTRLRTKISTYLYTDK